jgi:hypothetical protein
MSIERMWTDFGKGAWAGVGFLFFVGAALVVKAAPELRDAIRLAPVAISCDGFLRNPPTETRWLTVAGCELERPTGENDSSQHDLSQHDLSQHFVALCTRGCQFRPNPPVGLEFTSAQSSRLDNATKLTGMMTRDQRGVVLRLDATPNRARPLGAFALAMVALTAAFWPFARRFYLLKTGDV